MTKENALKELEVILGFATEIIMNGIEIEDIHDIDSDLKLYGYDNDSNSIWTFWVKLFIKDIF